MLYDILRISLLFVLLVRMQSNMASCGSGSSEIKVLANLDFVDVFPVE